MDQTKCHRSCFQCLLKISCLFFFSFACDITASVCVCVCVERVCLPACDCNVHKLYFILSTRCSFYRSSSFLGSIFFGPQTKFGAVAVCCCCRHFVERQCGFSECVCVCVCNNQRQLFFPIHLLWAFFFILLLISSCVIHPHGNHSEVIMIHQSMRGKSAECVYTR